MSGIVGILHTDGAPVDPELLGQLTAFLLFRGPDAQQTQTAGRVGFGHTLLRTTYESARENQPLSLDGETWIVADARVDARQDLLTQLRSKGHEELSAATDPELILRAYQVWGEQCVDHLLGDFVFAIWDAPRQRLFCARDQFGVKPFFYAHLGSLFLFCNTLDCIRQHTAVSDELNDLAIADFLLFDMNQDPTTTSFADIQRLPPAHTLICEAGRISVQRYWTLPVSEPTHFRRDEECVERFRELLDDAVADRLRTSRAGVFMSGGLDSSIVAASAQRVSSRAVSPASLRAYTQVFDSLVPHEERHYAGLVADALCIPIEYQTADAYALFDGADRAENSGPQPADVACTAPQLDQLRQLARQERVLLSGLGADPALSCRLSLHFRQLLKQREFGRAAKEAFRFLTAENRSSRLYLRTRWNLLTGKYSRTMQFPDWVNPELEKRYHLRQRFEELVQEMPPGKGVRPVAYSNMTSHMWPSGFELMDAGVTQCAAEIRHPFFDVRLVSFLLSLPPLPWCSDKELLREASRGVLPDEVRLRPKTPLHLDPVLELLRQPGSAWIDRFEAAPGLERYVVKERIPKVFQEPDSWRAYVNLRPLSLNYWLRGVPRSRINGKDSFKRGLAPC
jgi:asparagine synthase (glutamine-hydrolysing)